MNKTREDVEVVRYIFSPDEVQEALLYYLEEKHKEAMPVEVDQVRVETYRQGSTRPIQLSDIQVIISYLSGQVPDKTYAQKHYSDEEENHDD